MKRPDLDGFVERVRTTIERHGLLAAAGAGPQPVVAAVSGGPDSVAMLLALADLAQAGALALDITVAHLHHGLRGADADGDQAFVAALAARLGLAFETARADVRAEAAAADAGLEEAGRAARRRFLAQVARRRGARTIALGHTADDRAETVLFHILRGTGIEGLAAMGPRGILPSPTEGRGERTIGIIRPLVDVTRADVIAFLKRRGQAWREDETNRSDAYTRNRLRLEVLPLVRDAVNPKAGEALGRLADQAAAAAEVLADALDQAWRAVAVAVPEPDAEASGGAGLGAILLDADDFAALRPWMQGAILRRAVERLGGGLKHMSADRTAEAVRALLSRPDAGPVDLPGDLVAGRRGRAIRIARRCSADC